MALLLETTLGDLVIDLDVEGSPALCRNVLELAQARYYTQSLVYNIQANRFCQLGDPHGDGTGGACWQGVLDAASQASSSKNSTGGGSGAGDVTKSRKRFLRSQGRRLTPSECQESGRVVATEMKGIPDTIGSQFLITLAEGSGMALDGYTLQEDAGDTTTTNSAGETHDTFLSLGRVTEDEDNVLEQLSNLYCDAEGRPYADVRVKRASVIHNPFEDPPEMKELLKVRGLEWDDNDDDDDNNRVIASPDYERPPEERVDPRIPVDQVDLIDDENEEELAKLQEQQQEEAMQHDAKSRAVVLEMLGDLPSAEIKAPENVLFVCKMNPVTEDEDLELIFSRFDPQVNAEIIRDHDTGASLQYAFVEFTKKQQAVEAYFKMNNALVDDRRIKVDFSQSVAKLWDKYHQKLKPSTLPAGFGGRGGGRGGSGRGGGRVSGRGGRGDRGGRGRGDDRGRHDSSRHDNNNARGPPPDQHRRRDSGGPPGRGRGRGFERDDRRWNDQDDRRRDINDRDNQHRRPPMDEFGRSAHHKSETKNISRRNSGESPEDRHRSLHRHRSPRRSMSRSRSASPDRRHHDRNRSSGGKHRSSHREKKKRKHDDDRDGHHRHRRDRPRYDSDEEDREEDHKRDKPSKRRHDSDVSEEEERRHSKKHSKHHKHHKRRKRSRSRSGSRSR